MLQSLLPVNQSGWSWATQTLKLKKTLSPLQAEMRLYWRNPTATAGENCTDQIPKWSTDRRINRRGWNNKQEPEPWNKKTGNDDVKAKFPSPPLESGLIYDISWACRRDGWLRTESFPGLVTFIHTWNRESERLKFHWKPFTGWCANGLLNMLLLR